MSCFFMSSGKHFSLRDFFMSFAVGKNCSKLYKINTKYIVTLQNIYFFKDLDLFQAGCPRRRNS